MEDSSNKGESKPSTNDFVKKLYKYVVVFLFLFLDVYVRIRILEDPTFQSVVSWGPHGDCFFVKVRSLDTALFPLDLTTLHNVGRK